MLPANPSSFAAFHPGANNQIAGNPCSRCGQQRIISSQSWEKIPTAAGVSLVLFTLTVCPDLKCQKIVDEKQALLREQAAKIKEKQELRIQERKSERARMLSARKIH